MFRNPKFVRSIGVAGVLSWLLLVAFVGPAAAQNPVASADAGGVEPPAFQFRIP